MAESVTEESTKGKVSCKSADSAVISSAEDVSSIEESIESVEENAQKLAEYEELFKHRYTMEDPKYAATVNRPPDSPAIVDPWGGKPQRNFDYTRRDAQKRPYDRNEFSDPKRRRYDNFDRGRRGGYEPYGRQPHHNRGGRGDYNNPYRNRHEVGSRGYNDDTNNRQPRTSYSGSHRN